MHIGTGFTAAPLADTNLRLPTIQYSILRHNVPYDTKYGATLYAIVHEDAVRCAGPDGTEYDRVKVLQELGYHVNIAGSPFGPAQIADDSLREKLDGSAFRELVRLFAFDYTWHRMVGKFLESPCWVLLSIFATRNSRIYLLFLLQSWSISPPSC